MKNRSGYSLEFLKDKFNNQLARHHCTSDRNEIILRIGTRKRHALNFWSCFPLFQQKLSCKINPSINNDTFYEWELIDCDAAQIALELRHEFKVYASMNANVWKKKFYSLNKSYLNMYLPDPDSIDGRNILKCLQDVLIEENPNHLVTAYTCSYHFAHSLNNYMARNTIHSLKNGCSQFSCQGLYDTQDGMTTIIGIFLHHPNFRTLAYQGEVYRGIVMMKHKLKQYKVGSCVVTTTFLSTSKNRHTAQMFCGTNLTSQRVHSFLLTYKLTSNDRIGIDISKLSKYEVEEEVLILPYSSFLITKIEEVEDTTNIYLEEQSQKDLLEKI